MDITDSLAAKSDQLNSLDLVSGPVTVTIKEVRKGSADQPFDFHLTEMPGRPYRPSKGMRRVIAAGWGPEASTYTGRQLTLYHEPTVTWAGEEIGGIRISHMSHLDKPLKTSLVLAKTKRIPFTVQPLVESTPDATPAQREPAVEEIAACTDTETLRAMWKAAGIERQALIKARVAELGATEAPE